MTTTDEPTTQPTADVIDLEQLSMRLDHAAGAAHVLTAFDIDEFRSLAAELERVAAALDGDTTIQLVPCPWS